MKAREASIDRSAVQRHLADAVRPRLDERRRAAFEQALTQVGGGLDADALAIELSRASRYVPRGPLEPSPSAQRALAEAGAGVDIERWTLLEAARVALLLGLPDLDRAAGFEKLEHAFRFADEGELCALMRSLCLLPGPERFVWRAGEGCRSNMRSVFEAAACDTPYPQAYFDDVAWKQMCLKSLFVGAPLSLIQGIDTRLSFDLARMALDYADERRSAGREIPPELWMLLGPSGGERAQQALLQELRATSRGARLAALLGLARAGLQAEFEQGLAEERESDVVALARKLAQAPPDTDEGPRPGASVFRVVREFATA